MKGRENKRGFMNLSFGWIFGLIVGAAILFMAIFMATKYIDTQETSQSAQTGRQIEAWFNSLNTGENVSTSTTLEASVETIIENDCYSSGEFGRQSLRIKEKSMGEFSKGISIKFDDQYIFSESEVGESQIFTVFSKTFNFPFKVSNLIYLIPDSETYCFVGAEEKRREYIKNMNKNNLVLNDTEENCPSGSKTVCFDKSECDINVDTISGYVEKDENELHYAGNALMYAAIFSDKELYECQLKRLMKRTSKLSGMYKYKSQDMPGCDMSQMKMSLNVLENETKKYANKEEHISSEVKNMKERFVGGLNQKNDKWKCRLW